MLIPTKTSKLHSAGPQELPTNVSLALRLGEADEERRVSETTLRTPVMLASCKKSWPFEVKRNDKTIHVCVECKPNAPLPLAIARHGKRLIWACDVTKFKRKMGPKMAVCKKLMSWANSSKKHNTVPRWSATGGSASQICKTIRFLNSRNKQAASVFSKHTQDLKMAKKLTSEKLYVNTVKTIALEKIASTAHGRFPLGQTRVQVEKTVHASFRNKRTATVFTVASHYVRACGNIPKRPLQCYDSKRSKCVWSKVFGSWSGGSQGLKFHPKLVHGKYQVHGNKKYREQPCTGNALIALASSITL